jgi:D-beta-D-heptose 7-phosphate kinase/D-beta-D-heptose 1-phosphate adenosyltransferase
MWRRGAAAPVVFTNGVFDLLHAGHVALLEASRSFGASLVVAINSDVSVRALGKGPDRPWTNQRDRACILAALCAVDCVVLFDDPTPQHVVELLAPDILVKGGDYRVDQVIGGDVVRQRGGRVVIVPLLANRSSTLLLERIRGTT